ncbi:MAG TPA: nucleotidyltransferase family protein [Cytophagaceae bacterium]
MTSKIGSIVLAAGSSSRLGRSKQLLRVNEETLLRKSVGAAYGCTGAHTVVVLGCEPEVHQRAISDLPVKEVVNNDWKNGIGSSIKTGLKHLLTESPDIDAAIIMVCDQPLVSEDYLHRLIQEFESTEMKIIASTYASTVGVPALFYKSLFDLILKLEDAHGAKSIIESNYSLVKTVQFPEGAFDIDTEGDVEAFKRLKGV